MDKLQSLEQINPRDSGLDNFDRSKFKDALKDYEESILTREYAAEFIKYLGYFLKEDHSKIKEDLEIDPLLIASIEMKALKIINLLYMGEVIKEFDIFPFKARELIVRQKIARSIAIDIISLIEALNLFITGFSEKFSTALIDKLLGLKSFLPDINFYLAIYILRSRKKDFYDLIKNNLPENEKEKAFLESWIARLTGNHEEAETKLLEYRNIFDPDANIKPKLKTEHISNFYSPETTLENWSSVLKETKDLQAKVEEDAGLFNNTCEYFGCSDCCSNTFPTMSYTEFKYMMAWVEENNYDLSEVYKKAEEIQKDYAEKFKGKRLEIVDKSLPENDYRGSENPNNYKFSCPFLIDNRCSVHEARPILCRAFSSSTDNGVSIKSCQYYLKQYQHNSDPYNSRYAIDLRPQQVMAQASDKLLSKEKFGKEKVLYGTLVAWFSSAAKEL